MDGLELRPIGRSGVLISAVGLGGFELGPELRAEPDVSRATAVIGAAFDSGINWLDSSESYLETRNESLIGEALAQVDRDFLVATKVAPGTGMSGGGSGFRRDQVHQACRASLRRLGREAVDIYFLHWPDRTGVPLDETWGRWRNWPMLDSYAPSASLTTAWTTWSAAMRSGPSMPFRWACR